jgi:hypothetical protein
MRFIVGVDSEATDRSSEEAREILAKFLTSSGAKVIGDRDPVATIIDSERSLDALKELGGDQVFVERPVRFDFGI